MAELSRDTELVLPPGTYAFVLDGTKGHINTYSGPHKCSLSTTDSLVLYDAASKRFRNSQLPDAIQSNVICPKGCYVVLENPTTTGQPILGKPDVPNGPLQMGCTENLPGPQSFPLWPGQVATVVEGHHLRSNQYLVVRIADDEAAKVNWAKGVVQQATINNTQQTNPTNPPNPTNPNPPEIPRPASVLGIDAKSLVTGQHIIIKGTDVAFYIPPTGVEVLKEELTGTYIRDAETLERLEYTILLNENGNKEYRKGPDVVFPTPTQRFFTRQIINPDGDQVTQRKFRAFELQPTNGVHIKVIADYKDTIFDRDTMKMQSVDRKAGDELFLTGTESAIYYPREEHAIISYGGNEKSYAVAIPSGEGRYVLNRENGAIDLVIGPRMFLSNPIKEVIVRRVLSANDCELYYPGNKEVKEFNDRLREDGVDVASDHAELNADIARNFVPARRELLDRGAAAASHATSTTLSPFGTATYYAGNSAVDHSNFSGAMLGGAPSLPGLPAGAKGMAGDHLTRSTKYTPPRMITLDTKFDGAVRVEVWSGFAVQVVNSSGDRRTVIGPKTVLLDYDEYLERLSLSTGRPKSDNRRINTPYLRYISNPVSDIITLKTQDLVDVSVQIKYLIRFDQTESDKWFSMDNYVQYMADHLRSIIGNAVRNISVREFYVDATNILRDVVLGKKDETSGSRPLKLFDENGMVVYDLELIMVDVLDTSIATLLARSRQEILADDIALERIQQKTVFITGQESARRKQAEETDRTASLNARIAGDESARRAALALASIVAENAQREESIKNKQTEAEAERAVAALLLEIDRSKRDLDALYAEATSERTIREQTAIAEAIRVKVSAIAPTLVESLQALSLTGQFQAMAELAPLSIVEGKSLAGTMDTLFKGTPLEGLLNNMKRVSTKV